MRFLLLALPLLFVGAFGEGEMCSSHKDCDLQTECCQRPTKFPIVSKRHVRRQVWPDYDDRFPKTGNCRRYKQDGADCDMFEKANGFCGCGLQSTCLPLEVPNTDSPVEKRSRIAAKKGYYWETICRPKQDSMP